MSVYHPFFDDKERVWDIDPEKIDWENIAYHFPGNVTFSKVEKGWIARCIDPNKEYISTTLNQSGIPYGWIAINPNVWEEYIKPYIIPEKMINLDGEFDGDDIELAEIIMAELEELNG